ncbi:hypothetical protein CDIK_1206 [Cucumispora dikerogammari]|nr:hypothetical protein CDIK_1206 [Cucumispora dikerogammari]
MLNKDSICLIFDNARIHKEAEISRTTQLYGYSFQFLSRYSYMLNHIENAFSKIKIAVRSRLFMGVSSTLTKMIHNAFFTITPVDCSDFFRYMLKNITNCATGI